MTSNFFENCIFCDGFSAIKFGTELLCWFDLCHDFVEQTLLVFWHDVQMIENKARLSGAPKLKISELSHKKKLVVFALAAHCCCAAHEF